ncbi:hypothetical protein E4U43_006840 [Claviceps pusilla]|uniref:Uncharacterized protein n=1 Tax=Claviceps pusilla TaxID=123648 RepID=A0A9P7NDG7_9HYPO|nr:hypothetical protein E4U43_006840 [Claviceps pusilla]
MVIGAYGVEYLVSETTMTGRLWGRFEVKQKSDYSPHGRFWHQAFPYESQFEHRQVIFIHLNAAAMDRERKPYIAPATRRPRLSTQSALSQSACALDFLNW